MRDIIEQRNLSNGRLRELKDFDNRLVDFNDTRRTLQGKPNDGGGHRSNDVDPI